MEENLPQYKAILLVLASIITASLISCSVSNPVSKQARTTLLNDPAIRSGHIGISLYEPATHTYLYNYNAEKYFVPASNTKLFTLYAGMKYLGDSLRGLQIIESENKICLIPTGDPTLMHPGFPLQPVFDFLSGTKKELCAIDNGCFRTSAFGRGWAWDDYNDSYMNERSFMPVFGNNVVFSGTQDHTLFFPIAAVSELKTDSSSKNNSPGFITQVKRDVYRNNYSADFNGLNNKPVVVPFITSVDLAFKILADTLHKNIIPTRAFSTTVSATNDKVYFINSRPTDSLFKPMMHNSDNFFAEQTLLMASNERLGYMSDEIMIDSLLKSDLKDVPQIPKWVDGSGLSRYNLFTPLSFIYILEKMKNEFGLERLKSILPTAGEGTLANYFQNDNSTLYAKTGTLGNISALSGFLVTRKGKLLIFSMLVNNYQTGAGPVRQAMANFLESVSKNY